jgi:hypothetical protein
VLEKDREIYDIMHNATDWENWVGYEKLNVILGDARGYTTTEKVDYLTADIWQGLGDYVALSDTKQMCDNLNPKSVMFWGQELDFLTWCSEKGHNPHALTTHHWVDFVISTGIPLTDAGAPRYTYWCLQAGYALIMMRSRTKL